ncbi:MAG: hypothetical protein ACO33A_05855 [Hyphomonas sp.]
MVARPATGRAAYLDKVRHSRIEYIPCADVFYHDCGAATEDILIDMLIKSGVGYLIALFAAGLVYLAVANSWKRWIQSTIERPVPIFWAVLQWLSTAFLWSQWLIQDLANIFVVLPRSTVSEGAKTRVTFDARLLVFATLVMLGVHAWIFATRGGEIQKIVNSKTNITDIRAATLVDFIYGLILVVFKQINDVPMSTIWVFLGLLAGRQIAISYISGLRSRREAAHDVMTDVARAGLGLVVSVVLAVGLPFVATGKMASF